MPLYASSNITLPSSLACKTNSSDYPTVLMCFHHQVSSAIYIAFSAVTVLFVLPLCGAVLWKGFHRWWFLGTAPSSPSDIFVYYMVTTEVVAIVGNLLFWGSIYTCDLGLQIAGYLIFSAIYPAQQCIHCLTCVERYVAVVHPITYLGLRASGGLRVRHISCWAVCLVCVGFIGLTWFTFPEVPSTVFFVSLIATIAVVSFCSLAVLHNLLHPKVGSEGIDQSKLRAFYSILLITGTLVLRFVGLMLYIMLSTEAAKGSEVCLAMMFGNWLCIPSIVVVPLLYLHKQRALAWFSCTSKPEE